MSQFIVAVCSAAMVVVSMSCNLIPACLPLLDHDPKKDTVSDQQLGRVAAMTFVGLCTGILIAGSLRNRYLPAQSFEFLRAQFEKHVCRAVPDAVVKIKHSSPPLDSDAMIPWMARLRQEAGGFASAAWYADAGILNSPHCPSISIGTGHIVQAHTKKEFIHVRDLETGAEFFRRWITVAECALQ